MYIEGKRARAFSHTVDDVRQKYTGAAREECLPGEERLSIFFSPLLPREHGTLARSLGSRSLESRTS